MAAAARHRRSSSASAMAASSPPLGRLPLAGVVAVVDVRMGSDAQIDASGVVAQKMAELGAAIVKRFTPRVTHIVLSHLTSAWKDKIAKWQSHISVGLARRVDGRPEAQIVTQLWVNACYVSKTRMDEKPFFPISKAAAAGAGGGSDSGHLHLNGAMRQFVLNHPPPPPVVTPRSAFGGSRSGAVNSSSNSNSGSKTASSSSSASNSSGASTAPAAVSANRRQSLGGDGGSAAASSGRQDSTSAGTSAASATAAAGPPLSRHAKIQFQFGAAAALAAATLSLHAIKRKRRAMSMEPLPSDAIQKLLTPSAHPVVTPRRETAAETRATEGGAKKALDLDAVLTPEAVETVAAAATATRRALLSAAKRRKTMSEVPSATLSMPVLAPTDPDPQKKLSFRDDASNDCVGDSQSDSETKEQPVAATPVGVALSGDDAVDATLPIRDAATASAETTTTVATAPKEANNAFHAGVQVGSVRATRTTRASVLPRSTASTSAGCRAPKTTAAATAAAAPAVPTSAARATRKFVSGPEPATPPTPVRKRKAAPSELSSPAATTKTGVFTQRILVTPRTITKAPAPALKRQRVAPSARGSSSVTSTPAVAAAAARKLPLAPLWTPSRPPSMSTASPAVPASVPRPSPSHHRSKEPAASLSVLEMTPARVTESRGSSRALANHSSSVDSTPTSRHALFSCATDARVGTNQLERLVTPQRLSSSSRQSTRSVENTPTKTPVKTPRTVAASLPARPARAVIGITGVDLETRGVIECAVHAIDASMVAEPGYRKARVVKSVDYSAAVTHLIVGDDRKRTIKVLFAIARGAWIVSEAWVFASLAREQWLPEADFELAMHANKVARTRPEQRAVFKGLKFFVGSTVEPSRDVVQSLLQCAGGEICNQISVVDMCVCGDSALFRRAQRTGVRVVTAKWVFDSIGAMQLQDDAEYGLSRASSAAGE
ncbi:hypothetical protein PybrP1_012626 [[Pythium] brassicae (nom. inval.)]|nr:hypothetical protein PybrP1_012626 [[Pythium] brassicae (nom. inval.)]